MPSEHPKVTAYVPQPILDVLDDWKSKNGVESRSAAIVAILVSYLGVPYPVQHDGTAHTAPNDVLSTVLAELAKLSERIAALEQQMATSTALQKVPSTAPPEKTLTASTVQGKALSTAPTSVPLQPLAPLTQMALAKRLGVSDKAVEKRRKQGKENFANWSRNRDPDNIAWAWEGIGGRGKPLRFVAVDSVDFEERK